MIRSHTFLLNGRHTLVFHVGDRYFFSKNDRIHNDDYDSRFVESGVYRLWIVRDENRTPRLRFLREKPIFKALACE